MIREELTGLFDTLPPHEWAPDTEHCMHCGVPREAVEDGIIIKGCGVRRDKERELAEKAMAGARGWPA